MPFDVSVMGFSACLQSGKSNESVHDLAAALRTAATGRAVLIAEIARFAGVALNDAVAAARSKMTLSCTAVVLIVIVMFPVVALLPAGLLETSIATVRRFEAAIHAAAGFAVCAISARIEGIAVFVGAKIADFTAECLNNAVAACREFACF